MTPIKLSYYHAQAAKIDLRRKWQWMATWPLVYRYGERVQIVFEYPCLAYRIDIYIPELRIAIEIDESHHDRQAGADAIRQSTIEATLGCQFRRLKVDSEEGSLYLQLTQLFDWLDPQVQRAIPWPGPDLGRRIGRVARTAQDGSYSENSWRELMAAGIPDVVQAMSDDLTAVGVTTDTINTKPLVKGNPELGFAIPLPGINFVVSVTPTKKIKTLVTRWDESVPQRLGLILEGPQGGSIPYYKVSGMGRGDLSIDETLKRLIEFNDILRDPNALTAEE